MFSYIFKLTYDFFEWFSCKVKPELIHSDYYDYKICQSNFMERV